MKQWTQREGGTTVVAKCCCFLRVQSKGWGAQCTRCHANGCQVQLMSPPRGVRNLHRTPFQLHANFHTTRTPVWVDLQFSSWRMFQSRVWCSLSTSAQLFTHLNGELTDLKFNLSPWHTAAKLRHNSPMEDQTKAWNICPELNSRSTLTRVLVMQKFAWSSSKVWYEFLTPCGCNCLIRWVLILSRISSRIGPESDERCTGRQHSKKHSQTQLLLNGIRDLHAKVPHRSDPHPS